VRYFTDAEVVCKCGRPACDAPKSVNQDLATLLDGIREDVGRPVVASSVLRCAYWNEHEGGKPDSDHLTGDGADLRATTSGERYQLVKAALKRGARRVGIHKSFVHVGTRSDLAPDVMWLY
jgi:hypothetical protein